MAAPLVSGKDFFELVKAIGESKSKQEEDRIIAEEVVYLKKAVPQNTNKKKMKELVVRAMYVEMLGQDASFAYMKIVELCASTNIVHKKVGYLAASLCLSTGHEFRLMLINRIQQDMKSTNQLEACAALSAVCKLVTEDMIPAVIGDVVALMRHEMDAVRKKAMGALHRLYQMDKACVQDHVDKVRRTLCDKDPAVMGAALGLILDLCRDNAAAFKDLVPSLVSILKQITEHKLPKDFDYHRIPAPWIQMHILRILAVLGRGDQASSEGMYEVLADVMHRADTGINVGYAIVYEVVNTVTTIYPNPLLLDAAATSISRFIRSDSHNLKYIGIKGLAAIVKDHPKYAADHQMAVIDCLEDPDETLKRKTLDLLYRMTNSVNVVFIADKLLLFLSTATDDYFRTELVGQLTQCAERFAPSNTWYVRTMIRVFELAGDKVQLSVAQTLMQLIADGADSNDDDEDEDGEGGAGARSRDDELRREAVEDFLLLVGPGKSKLPEMLAQTLAWVLGEYGYLSASTSMERIIDSLCSLAHESGEPATVAHVVTAIMKLVAQTGTCPQRAAQLIRHFSSSVSLDVQQRCLEFVALLQHSETMVDVLPVDASCEDIDVDDRLSFLDGFVQQALAAGAVPYSPPQRGDDEDDEPVAKVAGLRMSPYDMPVLPVSAPALGIMSSGSTGPPLPSTPGISSPAPIQPSQGNQLLNTRGVGAVWGRKMDPPISAATGGAAGAAAGSSSTAAAAASTSMPSTPTIVSSTPSSSSTATTPATPATTTGPRVLTDKEKMAAALFGGVATDSDAKAAPKRRALGTPVSTWGTESGQPAARAPSPAVHADAAVDLLDMMQAEDSATPPPPMPPPAVPLAAAAHARELSILHGLEATPLAPPPPVPASAPPAPGLADVFAGLTMDAPAATATLAPLVPTAYPAGPTGAAPATGSTPLRLSTAEFGKRWGGCPSELKQSVSCSVRSLEALRTAVPPCFAHVESISASAEAIFAAADAGGGAVLVHVKLLAAKHAADVTIKAASKETCAAEAAVVTLALQSHL